VEHAKAETTMHKLETSRTSPFLTDYTDDTFWHQVIPLLEDQFGEHLNKKQRLGK